jgi:hypothetical protein
MRRAGLVPNFMEGSMPPDGTQNAYQQPRFVSEETEAQRRTTDF